MEHTDTLHGIVEQARKQNPSEPYLDYALIASTSASGSQSKNNTRKNRITLAASSNKTNKTLEVYPRKVMSRSNKMNRVSLCNSNFKHAVKDANSKFVCSTCNGCLFSANHDHCVVTYINDMNKHVKSKSSKSKKMEWKPIGKVFTSVGHRWLPIDMTFTIIGTQYLLTRITSNPIVPLKETSQTPVITPIPKVKVYRRRTKVTKSVIQIIYKFLGAVRYGNDHIAKIMGYGSKDTNMYTLSLADMMRSSPICLLSKASKTKSWLWHRMLSYLNFGIINELAKQGLVKGLPKLKYEKDHLCSACSLGKSKKHTLKPKSKDTIQEKLYLLHMDLCGPMRVKSINGNKYILAEAVATSCYTQNRSLIRKRHNKTPYELLHDRKPDLKYLHVFGALCYPTNDSEDLGKLKPKVGIGIFIGYAPLKKAYRIYNRQTRQIMETIHVDFDELTAMASE
ncbi:retrovirus-related pol polyprotein from transposon TNT 1-94 [Tanacetum coccineum]